MISPGIRYTFRAPLWQHAGPGGWHFVSLPKKLSREIRQLLRTQEQGWGRLPATARIRQTEWKTALWFDSKHDTYLLPLKTDVRLREKLVTGEAVRVEVWV